MNDSVADSIAERIAGNEATDDKALANCDEAIDNIIAALMVLDENLHLIKPENVPQQAALDNIKENLEHGVKAYFVDVVKDFTFFD